MINDAIGFHQYNGHRNSGFTHFHSMVMFHSYVNVYQKISGWWLTYPSERWWSSSVGMMNIPNIWYIWKVIKFQCSKAPTSYWGTPILGNPHIWFHSHLKIDISLLDSFGNDDLGERCRARHVSGNWRTGFFFPCVKKNPRSTGYLLLISNNDKVLG